MFVRQNIKSTCMWHGKSVVIMKLDLTTAFDKIFSQCDHATHERAHPDASTSRAYRLRITWSETSPIWERVGLPLLAGVQAEAFCEELGATRMWLQIC